MIQENISLKPFNTFGIEASAKAFAPFSSVDELEAALYFAKDNGIGRQMILGGGSNILLTQDFDGLVLKNEVTGITVIKEDDDHVYVKAGSGENWHRFVMHCLENDYAGVENLSLIPGNVGASPMQNIGAYVWKLKMFFTAWKLTTSAKREYKHFIWKTASSAIAKVFLKTNTKTSLLFYRLHTS